MTTHEIPAGFDKDADLGPLTSHPQPKYPSSHIEGGNIKSATISETVAQQSKSAANYSRFD